MHPPSKFIAAAAAGALLLLLGANGVTAQKPDSLNAPFGPNVLVVTPGMALADIQNRINQVYTRQVHSEFGNGRYALLFTPGDYHLDVPVGFYTQILGVGATPDAVHITGNMHADAALDNNNATTTFWRGAEGFSVTPTGGSLQWAVSQAVSFRRMHVQGDMVLHQHRGWASGGWMSDSLVDGNVDSGSQQQWISRNTEWKTWTGSNWNMVFVGVNHPPVGDWPQPPFTKVEVAPVVREKPFLEVDDRGQYGVRVPSLARDSTGISWRTGRTPGRVVPLSHFYIAHPESDTAATLNAALHRGLDLLFTPGIYHLTEPLRVMRADTVVFGLGFATLQPVNGTPAMTLADVDGITVSGLLFDAGQNTSPSLLQVGPATSATRHRDDPISLHDVFFRVGGATVGKVVANLVVNSNDVLIDHTWIWRADHGQGVGWTENTSLNGLVVNGSDTTVYGLFVEHHQQFQVLWNGERGHVFFYQSEIPYDPPVQSSWTSAPGTDGWASYKVGSNVTEHQAMGLGIYSVFRHPGVNLTRAIETPVQPGVRFEHMITVALDNKGEIAHVIDNKGEKATTQPPRSTPKVTVFP